MSDKRRDQMGYYWQQTKNRKIEYKSTEPLKCAICGKVIPLGSMPHLLYGKGFICEECSKRRWKKIRDNKK
jgi:DNA-directed RNA polymerase subunit RPC12/RpoP